MVYFLLVFPLKPRMYFSFFPLHMPQSRPHLTLVNLSKHKFVWDNDIYYLFCA